MNSDMIAVTIRLPGTIRDLMRQIEPDAPLSDLAVEQYAAGLFAAAVAQMGPIGQRVSRDIVFLNEDPDVQVGAMKPTRRM